MKNVALKWNVSRNDQDSFALNSQLKAKEAIKKKVSSDKKIIVLGGDNYRIGMGGGAVSLSLIHI